jgi:hypothetical protein
MSELELQEQAAIEAVAAHVSATTEKGGRDGPAACLIVAGKRIAIDVATIGHRLGEQDRLAKPRLRFDKVVLRTVGRLQAALDGFVPDGSVVIVTITAPIRLAARTAAALEETIRTCLHRRSTQVEDTIHGNRIRICIVRGVPGRTSKVLGFVHNPESDPDVLLRTTQSLLAQIGDGAIRRAPKDFAGDRWLVFANETGLQDVETYRHIWSALSVPTEYKKILMVFSGGRVESLIG